MTGNDLVDLEQAAKDSNWQRKGYLDKIYTPEEQRLILQSSSPNHMVWILWSMKEAVYKINSRKTNIRNFSPTSLICSDLVFNKTHLLGKVFVNSTFYYTYTKIEKSYIHTIAATYLSALSRIKVDIHQHSATFFDYKRTNPKCVSHHGRYLALIY